MKVKIDDLGYLKIIPENQKELNDLDKWCDSNNYKEINANIFIESDIDS